MNRDPSTLVTHERLKELLDYDPETGIFRWRKNQGRVRAGDRAGANGNPKLHYWHVTIDEKKYPLHRLAWFYVHGVWPTNMLDHKDITQGERIDNLREATPKQNSANRGKNRTSGWKGVYFDPGRKKQWKMMFYHPNGNVIQRRYEDEREAAEEYMFLALEHHGEFARFE